MAKKSFPILFSQACEGMIRYKGAIGLSEHTLRDYPISFKKLAEFLGDDPPLASITREKLIEFFAWLQNEYTTEPDGVARRGVQKLSQKSILNVHTNLSSLWEWAKDEGYLEENWLRQIRRPQVTPPVIEPFTREDVQLLLKAADNTRSYKNDPTKMNSRPTGLRDRCIILLLLDTGIRASELCNLVYRNVDFKRNRIKVIGKGPGREGKERVVFMGRRTSQLLWKYLLPRSSNIRPVDYVFLSGNEADNKPMDRGRLRRLLHEIGKRAGVQGTHPHRFRHTFAINFLRNDGNLFALQELLGHTTLNMVRRYARIAEVDTEAAHRIAGPVDNWRL